MEFDPYHRWLGIRKEEQPPDHYRLLGLARFEDDPEVIRDATERQMAHVRNYGLGKHADLSQKILTELSVAKVCLLDVSQKTAYDGKLHASTEPKTSASPISERHRTSPKGRTPPPLGTQTVEPSEEVDLAPLSRPSIKPPEPIDAIVVPSESWSLRLSTFLKEPQVRTAFLAGGGTFIAFLLLGLLVILLMTQEKNEPSEPPSTVTPSSHSVEPSDSSKSKLPSNLSTTSDTKQTSKAMTTRMEYLGREKTPIKATLLPRTAPGSNPNVVDTEIRPSESKNVYDSNRATQNADFSRPTEVSRSHTPVVKARSSFSFASKSPIPLSSGKLLDLSKISLNWQPLAQAMILKSSAYESLHNKQPDKMLVSRSNGEVLVSIFWYPNKSVKSLASFKSGIIEGNAIIFYDCRLPIRFYGSSSSSSSSSSYSSSTYENHPNVDWKRMHPMSFVSYSSGDRNGWLRMWNTNQTKRYWCEYRSGRRHGPGCYFENDQPRLVLEYAYDKIQKIHVIADGKIDRSFDTEEQANADATTGSLLKKAIESSDQYKTHEIALKKEVKTLDVRLAKLMVSILSPQKRKAMQDRIDRRAEEKNNTFRTLWQKGAGGG